MTNIECTICGSADVSAVLALRNGARIMKCAHCKNAFTYPLPLAPDYSTRDFQARSGDTDTLTLLSDFPEEIKQSYAIQLSLIQKELPKGSRILEIGGGEGIFLETVKNAGYAVELIEPSFTAAQRARKRGLHVHNDYFDNLVIDKKFDLVCMGHVLEHIQDPLSTIEKIKKILNPGGCIMLTQTNLNGFMPRFQKEHWYAWVPDEHFSHFSIAGLRYVAKHSGLEFRRHKYSRLVHGPSVYHNTIKYIPFLQDQIHVLLKMK